MGQVRVMVYRAGTWGAGRLEVSDVIIQEVSGPGVSADPYFDGSTTDEGSAYGWQGTPDASPSTRSSSDVQAVAKVEDPLTPSDSPGDYGRLSVRFKLPEAYWRGVDTLTWAGGRPTSDTPMEVTSLEGSSAPVEDAVVTLAGPAAAGVQIVDDATNFGVALAEALPAGSVWRVNSATWESRVGVGLTVDSSDTAGTDKSAVTSWNGLYPRYLRLHPRVIGGRRVVRVRVIGSGFTAATALTLKGRRAFL